MKVTLNLEAQELIEKLMEFGYSNPAEVVEVALSQMLAANQQKLDVLRDAVAVGAEQAERGEFSSRSFDEIITAAKASVLAE